MYSRRTEVSIRTDLKKNNFFTTMDYLYIGAKYDAGKVEYADGSAMDPPTMILYNRASKDAYRIDGEKVSGEEAYTMTMKASETANMIPGVYDMEIYINYNDNDEREMAYYERDAVKAIKVLEFAEEEESSSEESSADEESSSDSNTPSSN